MDRVTGGGAAGSDRAVFYIVVSDGPALSPARLLAAAIRAGLDLPAASPGLGPVRLGQVTVEAGAPGDVTLPEVPLPPEVQAGLGAATSVYLLRHAPGLEAVAEALALARILVAEVGGVVLDVAAGRVLEDDALERSTADELDAEDHVVLHVVQGPSGASWVHTHGLAKLGVPDLEAHGVPPDLVGEVSSLFTDLAGDLALGDGPEVGEPFDLPGGAVVLKPAAAVRGDAGVPAAELRGHDGPYLALVAEDGGALEDELRGYGAVELKSDEDVEVERAAAQSLFPRFVARAEARLGGEAFYVKAPFPVNGPSGETREHMWVELVEVRAGVIEGPLATTSFYEPERWPEGTPVQILLAEVEALAAVRDGEVVPDEELARFLEPRGIVDG